MPDQPMSKEQKEQFLKEYRQNLLDSGLESQEVDQLLDPKREAEIDPFDKPRHT